MGTLLEGDTGSKRQKLVNARKVAGSGVDVVAYGSGTGHSRFPTILLYAGIGYVVAFFVLWVLLGKTLIPGILLFLIILHLIRPHQGVAITSLGILVMHESMVNGQPNKIIFVAPLDVLSAVGQMDGAKRKVQVEVGPERIRMKRNTYESLLIATRKLPSGNPSAASSAELWSFAAWFQDPFARYQFRFWNGHSWTAHVSQNGLTYLDPLTGIPMD